MNNWFKRLIYDIKTEIKNELRAELIANVEFRISNMFDEIKDVLELEEMTDKEVIEFFKHSKFNEISKTKQDFLCQRYHFFISSSPLVSINSIDGKIKKSISKFIYCR